MEDRESFALQRRLEVDQHVSAADQVEMGEGRIAHDILSRTDADVAHDSRAPVADAIGREEAPQALGRYVLGDARWIKTGPGLRDRHLAQIGTEDLNRHLDARLLEKLDQGNGERIGLFASGAAGDPHAERCIGPTRPHQFGEYRGAELLEHFWIAEKARDPDEKIL